MVDLDDFDKKIIEVLRMNGRLSNVEVAKRVGLSDSSCSRRISRLEKTGVIQGYRALTDRSKVGLTVRAYCGVIRDIHTKWDKLAKDLANIDGVISIAAVSGEVDLMLEIVAKDMQHYYHVVLRDISNIKGVNGTHSSFVLEDIKSIF
ncbi:Lrp/AsnC family transcriptional regulator [Desulfopila aestuarii]|uniref:Lrp/AsnC family transcriptional regulator, leucine-responsive regulatory protein n=1 Tax=Desulfopila aestuarii DSM 18488 TaxID=1121416 RepID=A0A1M7YIU3_9BACT|nr:Lrp/AsnC family transcriptional regulator [Desulfopila aestuarii]SHO52554.1 Lrp/AsnC family transcriptional regulator, leucine-responsive regulatory protein [Desulfopila aestuarii DSM 18488]